MPSQEVEQWAAEFLTKDRLKRDERNEIQAWEASLPSVSYVQTSPTPSEMVGFYEADPMKRAFNDRDIPLTSTRKPKRLEFTAGFQAKKSEFTEALEQVYFGEREELSMHFLMQFTADELRAFGPGGQFEGLAGVIEQSQANLAELMTNEAEVERRFELAQEAWENTQAFQDGNVRSQQGSAAILSLFTDADLEGALEEGIEAREPFDPETTRRRISLEAYGRGDELFDDEIDAFLATQFAFMDRMRAGEDLRPANVARKERGGFIDPDRVKPTITVGDGRTLSDEDYARFFEQETAFLTEAGVTDLSQLSDDEYAALKVQRELVLRQSLIANPALTDVLIPGQGAGFVMGSLEALGKVIEKGVQGAGMVLAGVDWALGGVIVDDLRAASVGHQQQAIELYNAQIGAPPAAILAKLTSGLAQEAMEQLETENPDVAQQYLRMAGMDPLMAIAFLQSDMLDEVSPAEQIEYLNASYQEEQDVLRQMKEQDFTVGSDLLNILAAYGRLGPGRLSTWAMLLVTDSVDTHSPTVIETWGDFMHELERQTKVADYRPSQVLGIDGSVSGLMLDLGGGIAFDPVIWFTGPRLGVRGARPGSAASAKTLANSPYVRQVADDFVMAGWSPSKGVSAQYHLMDWLDPASRGEILNLMDINPQTLKVTPWKQTTLGKKAIEIKVAFLNKLIPDADMFSAKADDIVRLGDDMVENGVGEVLEITVSRADGTMVLSDGTKRALAADHAGVTHLPVVLKEVDDVLNGIPVEALLKEGDTLGSLAKVGTEEVLRRPDTFLPRRMLLGELNDVEILAIAKKAIIERGAVPSGAHKSAIARWAGVHVRQLVNQNKMGSWIERYFTPAFLGTRFETIGPHAMNKIIDAFYRIWGDDTAKLDIYLGRVLEIEKEVSRRSGESARRHALLEPEKQQYRQLYDAIDGNVWDDVMKDLKPGQGTAQENALEAAAGGVSSTRGNLAQAEINRAQWREVVSEADKTLRAKQSLIEAETSVLGYSDDIEKLIIEMWEDYNRTYIATNPVWANVVDPKTGLVPWDNLKKGRHKKQKDRRDPGEDVTFFSEEMKDAAKEMGIPLEELTAKLSNTQNIKLSINVPISPLELLMGRELGASAYTRFTQRLVGNRIREMAFALQRAWIIDKVMTPATAAVVSIDELMRGFNLGGTWSGQIRWLRDRALFGEARARAIGQGKIAKIHGASKMKAAKQERLRLLHDYPTRLKQAERQVYEQTGLGYGDISPNMHGYDDAARQMTGGYLQDSGFRAFLKGEDAFTEWYLSGDGARLRNGTVVGNRNGRVETMLITEAAEHFKGWTAVFDEVIMGGAKKAGKYDEVRAAWVDIARRIDEGGKLPKDLPDIAIKHLGDVRGVRRELQGELGVKAMSESFFDRTFMDPINYRRGWLAEMTRAHEVSRLEALFETQGKRIVSDAELESILGLTGLQGGSRAGLHAAVQEMALKAGYIPRSYIDDLAEKAVLAEVENTLYAFDVGSRLGSQAKAIFPFGKPWADMAGFWGREVMRQPMMRGVINDKNLLWLRSAADRGYLSPLVPNRASAMISRMAHTDFTIDEGIFGEAFTGDTIGFGDPQGILHSGGILPGSQKTDFSPMFFLPTGGDNPFSVMIPGLGFVPIFGLDRALSWGIDPIGGDAEEYQRRVDFVGQIIPAAHFQSGGTLSRALGGGVTSKFLLGMADIVGMSGNDSMFAMTSALGDISRETARNRETSALLADPKELELLLSAETPASAEALLKALVVKADINASRGHLTETVVRGLSPIKAVYDTALHEIQDVWFDADGIMPFGQLEDRNPANMTAEDRNQVADDIRTSFFALPSWQRDALVVQQPSLAVNIVGSWEWVPAAINEGLEGTQYSYRAGGSKEDLAQHKLLIDRGLIRPNVPLDRARRILGTIRAARVNTAKALYENQLTIVNDVIFDLIPDEVTEQLQSVLDSDFGKDLGFRTLREVWDKWRTLEEDLELWVAEQQGIAPERGISGKQEDLTEFDQLRKDIVIDDDYDPWGTTFPGLEEEDVTEKFNEWIVEPDIETKAMADALGITLEEGMTGEELFEELQQQIVQTSPIFSIVQPSYDRYTGDRSISTGENALHQLAQSTEVHEDYQDEIKRWLFENDLMGIRWKDMRRNGLSLADQTKMRESFLAMWVGSKDESLDWQGIWDEQYKRRYGPLDWTTPEPISPVDEEGRMKGGVMAPFITHVVDGDTLEFKQDKNSPIKNSVRLLGIRAPETSGPEREDAFAATVRLMDALLKAARDGDRIYLVRDERFGNTDRYGRMLAWLWIGDTPYYNPEDLRPHQDPTGGDN